MSNTDPEHPNINGRAGLKQAVVIKQAQMWMKHLLHAETAMAPSTNNCESKKIRTILVLLSNVRREMLAIRTRLLFTVWWRNYRF